MIILSLPDEVLYRVFHYLDCWGILAARSTCWRLYAISKSLLLWQFKALETSYSSGIPLLEEPVENYTSEELEEKVIMRARTYRKWRQLDPAYFQWRKIPIGYLYRAHCKLKWLPGGRWLILNPDGCVNIIDLDRPGQTREPLFDANDSLGSPFLPTIWIDPTKCWLSPRIVLYRKVKRSQDDSSQICIYQLNSTGRGLNMKWSAEEMAIIRASARGPKGEMQLEREYVLEGCLHRTGNNYSVKAHLYQYSNVPIRSCEWDWELRSRTLLLPKSRIGVVTQTHIKISIVNPEGSDGLRLQPTFSTLLDPIPPSLQGFQLCSTLHYSYLNIASEDAMFEIQFPHDANEVYQKKITFAHGPMSSAIKGPSLLVRRLDDDSIDFISYKPEEGCAGQDASQICIRADVFRDWPTLIACDVTSGRLLMCDDRELILLEV